MSRGTRISDSFFGHGHGRYVDLKVAGVIYQRVGTILNRRKCAASPDPPGLGRMIAVDEVTAGATDTPVDHPRELSYFS